MRWLYVLTFVKLNALDYISRYFSVKLTGLGYKER